MIENHEACTAAYRQGIEAHKHSHLYAPPEKLYSLGDIRKVYFDLGYFDSIIGVNRADNGSLPRLNNAYKIEAQEIWEKLRDIPVDNDGHIDMDFNYMSASFPRGTHREVIWKWIEDKWDLSVMDDLI